MHNVLGFPAMTTGDRIKELRNALGLSQEGLAYRLKQMTGDEDFISRNTIDNYEGGKTDPSLSKIVAIADLFEVSLDDLVQRKAPWTGEERRVPTAPDGGTPAAELPETMEEALAGGPVEEDSQEDPARRRAGSA
jgi:transcriptional regulator with XRE-family HTH domain